MNGPKTARSGQTNPRTRPVGNADGAEGGVIRATPINYYWSAIAELAKQSIVSSFLQAMYSTYYDARSRDENGATLHCLFQSANEGFHLSWSRSSHSLTASSATSPYNYPGREYNRIMAVSAKDV